MMLHGQDRSAIHVAGPRWGRLSLAQAAARRCERLSREPPWARLPESATVPSRQPRLSLTRWSLGP
jgi:hypothetical protein